MIHIIQPSHLVDRVLCAEHLRQVVEGGGSLLGLRGEEVLAKGGDRVED